MKFGDRLKHAWNAFTGGGNSVQLSDYGPAYGMRPDRVRSGFGNEKSIIGSIYTRIGIDVASVDVRHIKVDDKKRYVEDVKSELQNCLSVEANIDQGSRALIQDIAMTMFEEGAVALVPIDTTLNPNMTGSWDIKTMRVGLIVGWHPEHVRVNLFNEKTGRRQDVMVKKRACAIIENPFFSVMNEPNSTLRRLLRKLQLLDTVDEAAASGKLDLLVQLPYAVKSEVKREQAEQRRKDIEFQLKGSKYGIAYIDGTEKVTQLNRPAENNLLTQIEYLTKMLYGQLGITEEVMNGTADEAAMVNYMNRTVEPILEAITEAMRRSFLTKTARSQGHEIRYFRNSFKLVPLSQLADLIDKLSRNEVVASNEWRGIIGLPPSDDPKADQLVNSNMPQPDQVEDGGAAADPEVMGTAFDDIDAALDDVLSEFDIDSDAEEVPDELEEGEDVEGA